MQSKELQKNSITTAVILNLSIIAIFAVLLTISYQVLKKNSVLNSQTFHTRFQSRLLLKSNSGLAFSMQSLTKAYYNKNEDLLVESLTYALSAKSDYQIFLSETRGSASKFQDLTKDYDSIINQLNSLLKKGQFQETEFKKTEEKLENLISETYEVESSMWVTESANFTLVAVFKDRNSDFFWFILFLSILIEISLIYFSWLRFNLIKKINDQHEKLIMSTRLSTLGEMSAGLAHEINTPLMVIGGRLKIIKNDIELEVQDETKLKKNLEIISRNSYRIQQIVKNFQTFSKSGENDNFEIVMFDKIFEDLLELVERRLLENRIELKLINLNNPVALSCRPVQVLQIITNLINNSIDAIKNNEIKWISIESRLEDEKCLILITDSGSGIVKEVVNNLFDPFFTTKNSKEGTGLGLSISRRLMNEHSGQIEYNSNHHNTQFILNFPTISQ